MGIYFTMFIAMLCCLSSHAAPGALFTVTATGTGTLNGKIWLNGKGPLSGQTFSVTGQTTLTVTPTVPNHTYPAMGIEITTPGFAVTAGCNQYINNRCIFSASNTSPAALIVGGSELSCKGTGGACRMFVTNASWATGNIQDELKYTCTDQSSAAIVANCACNNDDNKPTGEGSYLAWLSNGVQTGSAIVHSTANLTYIAPQNSELTLWDLVSTLVSGNNPYVDIAFGVNQVWSGLNADGTSSGQNCSNWTSSSALLNGTIGNSEMNDNRWSDEGQQSCDGPGFGGGLSIYCFETLS